LELLRRYVQRRDLAARLRRACAALGGDYNGASLSLHILALLYTGARRLEHLRYLAGDPLITRFCGLAHVPTPRTVSNWLQRFTQERLQSLVQLNQDLVTDTIARLKLPRLTVVSPDAGGVERARAYAKRLDASLAIVDKRRESPNVAEVHHVVGEVDGRTAMVVDDMVDTGGTLAKVAHALKEAGAREVLASASHAVLSGKAMERIEESPLSQLIVTDSIPLSEEKRRSPKIVILSIAELMGKAIRNIHEEASVTSLFV